MTVKTRFTPTDFSEILAQYDLGDHVHSQAIEHGTVQTNYFLTTTSGKYVFRAYENRARASVLFERDVLAFLSAHGYPCPAQIKNKAGAAVGAYRGQPYVISEFIAGQHIEEPNDAHKRQLVQQAAELQRLTQDFRSDYTAQRWNYDPELCRTLAHAAAMRINTPDADAKFAWLAHELTTLDLPTALPKGICHCDFHFSNILFHGDEFVALLDFDDANYTFLQFDLIGLIEYWACPHPAELLDLDAARAIVQEYSQHRPLAALEQQHLYDVYKLSILIDCVWFFDRGAADDFYERRKIDALNNLGREQFYANLFGL